MGISCEGGSDFPLGALVRVRRGKHQGAVFAVVGVQENPDCPGKNARILIADGARVSAARPKRKSTRHVERTGWICTEAALRLAEGKKLDDGWLCEAIRRAGEQASQLVLEEVG